MTRGEHGADEFVRNASVHLPPEKARSWGLSGTAICMRRVLGHL